MRQYIINAETEQEAIEICRTEYGFTPDAIRECDSGEDGIAAWLCFESAQDAELWDKQV